MTTNDSTSYLPHCRKVSREQMQVANRLGRGLCFQFTGKDQHVGTLTLRYHRRDIQHAESPERWTTFQTACGPFHVAQSSAEALLSQFSAAPFTPEVDPHPPAAVLPWFVALYNHHLYLDFKQLFGTITPASASQKAGLEVTGERYELAWQHGTCSGFTDITLSSSVLEQWLTRQPWQPVSRLDISELCLTRSLTLGDVHLQPGELINLSIGDILIPTRPYFSTQGVGQCHIGPYLLQLCAVEQGTISAYEITHVHKITSKETNMNDDDNELGDEQYNDQQYNDEQHRDTQDGSDSLDDSDSQDLPYAQDNRYSHDDSNLHNDRNLHNDSNSPVGQNTSALSESATMQASQHQSHDALPQIWATPITLTLQAGQISLPLSELSQLQAGSVLVATGESPGHATLYHGRQPIARGELVDVEGRLGIQISSLSMGYQSGQMEQGQ